MVPMAEQQPPGVSVQTELDAVTIRLPAGLRASSVNRSLVLASIAVTGYWDCLAPVLNCLSVSEP